eukprot:scaffold2647_cov155-Skeletonema_dohrnii-CCMP3373.AAC.3
MSSLPSRRSSPRRQNQKQRRQIHESDDDNDDSPAKLKQPPPPNSATRNLPPRGEQIPIDEYGMEDEDAFFAAGKSPAPGSAISARKNQQRNSNATTATAEKKARRQQQKQQQRRREYEELEEEGERNVSKGPAMLGGNNNTYQQTPKQPTSFTSRALQRAMGVLDDDDDHQDTPNSQYTMLSKVSTAAPSTRGSYGMDNDDSIDNTSSIIDT